MPSVLLSSLTDPVNEVSISNVSNEFQSEPKRVSHRQSGIRGLHWSCRFFESAVFERTLLNIDFKTNRKIFLSGTSIATEQDYHVH